ncbi:MAG: hypothetical protein JO267_06300 [Alphaproteobacteria bacterium]|nr:hypothetical protein [Alphaproteobacteria bacterium]MBV9861743.1 hypothetical protein [Alphaproteobacteria bacterium]
MRERWYPTLIVLGLLGGMVYTLHADLAHRPSSPRQLGNETVAEGTENKGVSDWWLVVLTGGLVGVGFLQAQVSMRQRDLMSEQTKIIRSQAEQSVQTMRALIFKNHTEDRFHLSDQNASTISQVSINIRWHNFGNTPGLNAEGWAEYSVVRDMVNQPDPIFLKHDPDHPYIAQIGPRVEFSTGPILIPYAEVNEVVQQKARIFVWSRVEYSDVFMDTPRRVTEICEELIVLLDPNEALTIERAGTGMKATKAILFRTYGRRHNAAT